MSGKLKTVKDYKRAGKPPINLDALLDEKEIIRNKLNIYLENISANVSNIEAKADIELDILFEYLWEEIFHMSYYINEEMWD